MEPFSEEIASTLAAIGEKDLLRALRDWLGPTTLPSPYGMGDDCAVRGEGEAAESLMTTDSLVLGRHFEADTLPELAGAKLLKRNLSDIAAMGGQPTRAVLAGFLPRRVRLDWLEAFCRGLAGCAQEYQIQLAGGDLAETDHDLAFNLTLLGTAPSQPLLRTGGKPGDWIVVTGALGGSRLGRHLTFQPRLREGRIFAGEVPAIWGEAPRAHAGIDISDGLAIDLLNMLPEDLSGEIEPDAVPLHRDVQKAAEQSGHSPLWHALNDGEDHELLVLLAPMEAAAWRSLQARFAQAGLARLTRIGQLAPRGPGRILDGSTGKPFAALAGYDHFR